MEKPTINKTVIMSDTDNFAVVELNPYSNELSQPNRIQAKIEHNLVKNALTLAGVEIITVPSVVNCQDSIYVANWGFISDGLALCSKLPTGRTGEMAYAQQVLKNLGIKTITPDFNRYSGQGDTLICGDKIFVGTGYRSSLEAIEFIKTYYGNKYNIIPVQSLPILDNLGNPVKNKLSGWPDSYFYDADLFIGIVDENTIAWCPDAMTPESRERMADINDLKKIEVSYQEAISAFACNFLSTGNTIITAIGAPKLQSSLEVLGKTVLPVNLNEINKGGGSARCITLTV